MQVSSIMSTDNSPTFGAYFNTKNAIHLKRLCKGEFDELSRYKLNDKLDWFTKELPNHELEITQFENLPGFKTQYAGIATPRRHGIYTERVLVGIEGRLGRYTITNKDTGNSADIYADNIFQFFDGIKERSETLFSKTKNSLTEGLNELGAEIINKLTTKQ